MDDVVVLFYVSWNTIGSGIKFLSLNAHRSARKWSVTDTQTQKIVMFDTYDAAKASYLDAVSKLIDAESY